VGVGRVAVVVAAGVGDKPRGDAAERIANGLRMHTGFDEPVQHAEWYEVPKVGIEPVDRFETAHDGAGVDIYEFWWADLSRFPAAERSFLAAFFGLFLVLPSFGRTALRPTKEIGYEVQTLPPGKKAGLDYHLLGFLGWVVAVPILVISALLLAATATLSVAVTVNEGQTAGAIGVALVGIGTAAVGTYLMWRYEKSSGRQFTLLLWLLALAGATVLCVLRIDDLGAEKRGIELALADTVSALVAYPMRILWLAVLALAAAMAIVMFGKLGLSALFDRKHVQWRVKRTVTTTLTVAFGPFGFATLMAILSAAVGGIAQKVGTTVVWGAKGTRTPLCLTEPDSWTLKHCPPITAWDFGTLTLGNGIFALLCTFAVLLAVLAIYLMILIAGEIAHRMRARGVQPKEARPAYIQASRISLALGAVGGAPGAVFLLFAMLAGTYAGAAAWLPSWWLPFQAKEHAGLIEVANKMVPAGGATTIAAALGATVSGLLIAARVAGISPQKLATNSGASNFLRLILDKPYDIATFLRDPVGSGSDHRRRFVHLDKMPRQRILDRYRALLVFLATRGYDRVVFAAHSQGTVLTVTLLHEPKLPLPRLVSLVTFGCPLRQLYSERFPSQFEWVLERWSVQEFVPRVNETWVNLGTAGDPVGRTVFEPVPKDWRAKTPVPSTARPAFEDVQLGKGGHSAYWDAEDLYKQLARLIDATGS
jgi:hypothetical protein